MKIAVIGASGLIGGHVVRGGVARGHDMVAVGRATPAGSLAGLDVPFRIADVLGPPEPLVEGIADADVVVHCAANFSYGGDGGAIHLLATQGTEAVLRAAHEAGVRRVVVTSSSVVFGYSLDREPVDEARGLADSADQPAYVVAKIEQDRLALDLAGRLGLEVVLACPTMSVGGHATTLGPSNALITDYLADPTRTSFQGGCNIVSVRDVGVAHILLAERGTPGSHYLLGAENLLWTEIHAMIGVLAGVGGPHSAIGPGTARLITHLSEAWSVLSGARTSQTTEQAGMLGRYYWYRHERAAELGYAPMPAAAALIEAVSWLAASPHVPRAVRSGMRLADVVQQYRYAGHVA